MKNTAQQINYSHHKLFWAMLVLDSIVSGSCNEQQKLKIHSGWGTEQIVLLRRSMLSIYVCAIAESKAKRSARRGRQSAPPGACAIAGTHC